MDFCTNLSNKVLDLESEMIDIKSTYQVRIEKLESRVERLEEENRVLKELKSVHSKVDSNEPVMEMEKSSKQGRKIADIDADVLSMLDDNDEEPADVEEVLEMVTTAKLITKLLLLLRMMLLLPVLKFLNQERERVLSFKTLKKQQQQSLCNQRREKLTDAVMNYQALKRKPLTEAQARRNMIIYLKNIAGYKMDYFKGMSYDEIRPLFEKHYNYNQAFLNEVNKGVKVLEKEVSQEKEVEVEISKREGKSLKQEIAKKQKMEQETGELKKHLQIVPDDDDDVYTDATSLASKIPIIDYKIHTERNRPYFKIIRVDGNHIERFAKIEPNNYSDDFLLNTLKIMFEKPNVEANVWKYQKGKYGLAKVKIWKFIESCGVHCLNLSTTQTFLLVERMYPLTHFTLEQMMNDVRLEVKDESEMSLEHLRLVRRQLNKGYVPQ
nr:hypothetical protein [Tanacetum cinerariifolium]